MQMNTLGRTGLKVSRLGVGAAEIGLRMIDDARAAQVLNTALDEGINFVDTAACYGISEELIGRTIAHRREEYVLSTKCGHVTGGYEGEPWTARTIGDSIDRSLVRLRTDCVDLLQLHSCERAVLEKGEVVRALLGAQQAGKTRFIGYSGDNEAAQWAIDSGHFDTLQTSFSLVDQRALTTVFPMARAKGMGIIAKRPIANAAWGTPGSDAPDPGEYVDRARAMAGMGPIPSAPDDPILLALGFVFAHDEMDTIIVGTSNPAHMKSNITHWKTQLPIAVEAVEALHSRFAQVGRDWRQRG
jgi:aryl-alcohol dehydrogenase-like predicted oxidoreductase